MPAKPKSLVLCVSLKSSPRRWVFHSNALKHSVQFQFFDAISVDDLRKGVSVEGCRIDLTNLNWTFHERHDPRRQLAPLLFAEIGCAYSHILCWRRGEQDDVDFLIMFEDDAVICRRLEGIDMPTDFDILYLSDRMPRNARGEAVGYGCGADGYILSRAGISKSLYIFNTLYMPVDLQLMAHQQSQIIAGHGLTQYRRQLPNDLYLRAYVTEQPYCFHPKMKSSIL